MTLICIIYGLKFVIYAVFTIIYATYMSERCICLLSSLIHRISRHIYVVCIIIYDIHRHIYVTQLDPYMVSHTHVCAHPHIYAVVCIIYGARPAIYELYMVTPVSYTISADKYIRLLRSYTNAGCTYM